jgi:hypothetical protein
MSFENGTTPEIEAAIDRETNRLIAVTCEKHQLHPSQLPPSAVDDARRVARENYGREEARKSNPMYSENELLRQKLQEAEAQLFASRNARTSAASANSLPAQSTGLVEVARAKLGEYQWNHVMTPATRLQAIGVQPSEVTPAVHQEIEEVFGPKSTSTRASEMFRADPARYRRLKEIGRCLRII